MRGKGPFCGGKALSRRITPAYAGKSHFEMRYIQHHTGSPPPMRGKDIFRGIDENNFGITPAYAGKSFIIGCRLQAVRDHPRLCGEKYTRSLPYLVQRGSPPPMRGKVFLCVFQSIT